MTSSSPVCPGRPWEVSTQWTRLASVLLLVMLGASSSLQALAAPAPPVADSPPVASDPDEAEQQNAKLHKRLEQVAREVVAAANEREAVEKQLTALREEIARTKKHVEAAGLTNAIGLLLRKQRADLPDVRHAQQQNRARQQKISAVQQDLFDLEEGRRDLASPDPVAAATAAASLPSKDATDPLRTALDEQRQLVEQLTEQDNAYFRQLVELDTVNHELIDEAESYAAYIDERVLWIRSAPPLGENDIPKAWEAIRWLGNPSAWWETGRQFVASLTDHLLVTTLIILVLVPLLFLQPRLRRQLRLSGELAASAHSSRFGITLRALVITVLMAALCPAIVAVVGWRLSTPLDSSPLSRALAAGLLATASVFFPLECFRQLCRKGGLGEAHFGWPAGALAMLRRHLRWLIALGLPLMLLVGTLESQPVAARSESLGRAAFIVGSLLLALFMQRVLRPVTGALHQTIVSYRGGWIDRLRYMWYVLFVLAPLVLAALAGTGYYYTALRLSWRLQATLWLLLGLLVINALLVRWLLLAHRRLALQQADAERQANEKAAAPKTTENVAHERASQERLVDLGTINAQTRQLLQSFLLLGLILGLGLIWIDVLPALGMLNQIRLWSDGGGQTIVSLQNLMEAVAIVVMTVIASKNIPGLLSIVVLQRLPVEQAVRYAIITVSRYAIVLIGLVWAFTAIGIGWSKVQWLAAAITVGLGFGLQEIFANFVSGLIILFERPLRVGDTITIGKVSGVVSRVRMRATTIVDWDRKEWIIPNKEFITGQLQNWTLTDQVLRIVITVGVVLSSNPRQTQRVLQDVANGHPGVLKDPAPQAALVGFGDSSLNFEVRVYVPGLGTMGTVQHDLLCGVHSALHAAHIEMATPQRDLHIRSYEGPAVLPTQK